MSIIDSQEPAYRGEHEIDVLTKRIKKLERMLEHNRLEIICYKNEIDKRDALICDMSNTFAKRMRELGIKEK